MAETGGTETERVTKYVEDCDIRGLVGVRLFGFFLKTLADF